MIIYFNTEICYLSCEQWILNTLSRRDQVIKNPIKNEEFFCDIESNVTKSGDRGVLKSPRSTIIVDIDGLAYIPSLL